MSTYNSSISQELDSLSQGILFALIPHSYPLNKVVHKIVTSLLRGHALILKPSSKSPIGTLFIAYLYAKTLLPNDALQVMSCGSHLTKAVLGDKRINAVSFTGSEKVLVGNLIKGWLLRN